MIEQSGPALLGKLSRRAVLEQHFARLLGMFRRTDRIGTALHITVIRVIALVGNVFCGLLTAAFLGPDGRGEQAALIVAPTVLAAVSTLGLHASLIYNVRNDPTNASRYFGTAALLCAGMGVLAICVGWVVVPFWLHQYSSHTIALARLLLLTLPVAVVSPLLTGVLEAHGRFGVANRVLYLQSLTTLGVLVVLAIGGWMTPHITALAYILPCLPGALYLWVQAYRTLRPHFALSSPYPKRLLHFGLKFYGVDILGAVSGYLDQALIIFLLTPASVGAYAVALSLSRILYVVQGAVATVLFPTIAGRDPADVIETVARVTRVTFVINAAGAVGIGLVGPFLLVLLYGDRFAGAVVPFLILLVEAVITSSARTLAQAFSGTGRPGAVTETEMMGVIASTCSLVVLVPVFGINGAASATLAAGCVRLAWVLIRFQAVLGVKLPPLVINRSDVAWVTRS